MFTRKAYSTPPLPINVIVSLAQILIVAAAVIAPGLAVKPGTGKAFTVTKTSLDAIEHVTPFRVFTVRRR